MSDRNRVGHATRTLSLVAIVAAILCGFGAESAAARQCTAEERAAADKRLWLSQRDKDAAVRKHLLWGAPKATQPVTNEELLVQRDYVIDYDDDLRIPIWSAERIDARRLGKVDRIDCFRQDPRLKAQIASSPSDYKEPIFDQGHMTPNGDMSLSTNAVVNSFLMSNMTPQYCQFNRGVWQIFETLVRHWAQDRKTVYVITGSILDQNGDGRRDEDAAAKHMKSSNGKQRVAILSHLYKIVASEQNGELESLAVVLPHDQTDVDGAEAIRYIASHVQSIEDIESVTGLKFFPNLDRRPRQAAAPNLWDTSHVSVRSLVDDRCRATAGADR